MSLTNFDLAEAMKAVERRAADQTRSMTPLPVHPVLTITSPEHIEQELSTENSLIGGPVGTFAYNPPPVDIPLFGDSPLSNHPFDLKVLKDETDEDGNRNITYTVLRPTFNLFWVSSGGEPLDQWETAEVPDEGFKNPYDLRLVLCYTIEESTDSEGNKVNEYKYDHAEIVADGRMPSGDYDHRREFELYKFDYDTHEVSCDNRHAFISLNRDPMTSGGGGGGDGEITVDSDAIVAISMDYCTDTGDNQYSIRLKRGRLKNDNGVLKVVEEDPDLTQYINTTTFSFFEDVN